MTSGSGEGPGLSREQLAGISRRSFLQRNLMIGGVVIAGGGLSGLLSACGGDSGTTTSSGGSGLTVQDVEAAKGTITVYGWSSENAPLQNDGPVKAKWTDIAGDAAQIPIKIKPEGSFDVFTSNAGQMEQYFATGRLAPIDTALLSNYEGINATLRDDPVWKGPDGAVYAVPIILGPALIAWDSNKVGEPGQLEDLLKPEYTGGIGIYDDYQMINTVAQGLGLPQPPELTASDFDQVKEFLEKLRPQVKTFYTFGGEAQLFGRGDITVAYSTFASLIVGEQESNPAIKTNTVSSVSYADAFSVLKGSNEAASIAWINQAIAPAAMKNLAEVGKAPTTLQSANAVLPKQLQKPLSQLVEESPIVGPYPLEASGDKVTVEEATAYWTEYKASFT